MQADIHALVILYVDCYLLREMQSLATFSFDSFEIGPDLVVGFTSRNALREFANMIGGDFPLGLLVACAPDLDRHSINGMIVGSPDRSKNKGIMISRLQLLRRGRGIGRDQDRQTQRGEKTDKQNAQRRQARERTRQTGPRTRHRLQSPLLLPLPRTPPRPPSTPVDWS